jgi:integrase
VSRAAKPGADPVTISNTHRVWWYPSGQITTGEKRASKRCPTRAAVGTRLCETLALHSSCIDRRTGDVHIVRQLDRYQPWRPGEPPPVRAPKHARLRTAVCFEFFLPHLSELADWADEHTGGWLFPPTRGQRWWADAYRNAMTRAVDHLNNQPDSPTWQWRQHYLRHFYGTTAYTSVDNGGYGWEVGMVAEAMGHSSPDITTRIYVQKTSTARERARQASARIPGLHDELDRAAIDELPRRVAS